MWPTCNKSKQPLVNTIFFESFLASLTKSLISVFDRTESAEFRLILSSASEGEAVPDLPTTIHAAALASFTDSSRVIPLDKAEAKLAITVSPAPETSNTSLASVEKSLRFTLPFSF